MGRWGWEEENLIWNESASYMDHAGRRPRWRKEEAERGENSFHLFSVGPLLHWTQKLKDVGHQSRCIGADGTQILQVGLQESQGFIHAECQANDFGLAFARVMKLCSNCHWGTT